MNPIESAEITSALWIIVALLAELIYQVSGQWIFLIVAVPSGLWGLWCLFQAIYFLGKSRRG